MIIKSNLDGLLLPHNLVFSSTHGVRKLSVTNSKTLSLHEGSVPSLDQFSHGTSLQLKSFITKSYLSPPAITLGNHLYLPASSCTVFPSMSCFFGGQIPLQYTCILPFAGLPPIVNCISQPHVYYKPSNTVFT